MPKLAEQDSVTITLPSSKPNDPSTATIRPMTALDMKLYDQLDREKPVEASIKLISKLILEWNFVDKAGQPALINEENVGKLAIEDFLAIEKAVGLDKIAEGTDEGKKKAVDIVPPRPAKLPTPA
jgi:hypothetical protein